VHTGFWWKDLMDRVHLEGLGVYETILLKWIIKKWDGDGCTVLYLLRTGRSDGAGTYECSNGPLGSIKCREFLDKLRTC
jgi:hypothetical protein